MRAPPGIEQPDDRRAVLQRHILDLGDLLRMRLAERAAEHREILGENEHRATVDGAPAGDDAVARDFALPMPKSSQRCSTNMSNSSKESGSSNSSMRSRDVSLPLACCAEIRSLPPPRRARSRRASRRARMFFTGGAGSETCGSTGHSTHRAAPDKTIGFAACLRPKRPRPGCRANALWLLQRPPHHAYLAPNAPRTPFRFSPSLAPTANS